jgi:murein DD-endopeptidase MepM/ murein hydrolase activator NlpD
MSEEFNNKPSLEERLRELKLNRPAVISAAVLVAAVVIVSAVAIANNRAKKNETTSDTTVKPPQQTEKVELPSETDKPADTQTPVIKPADTDSKPVADTLPSFILPVSGALSKKHNPDEQVYSDTMNDYRVHLGIDIIAEEGAPVYAVADGTVMQIWEDVRMGQCIAVKHNGDSVSIYKNVSVDLPTGIKEGTKVKAGQQIASIGATAMVEIADEPHLHFEMTVGGLAVDPLDYFSSKDVETLQKDTAYEQTATEK